MRGERLDRHQPAEDLVLPLRAALEHLEAVIASFEPESEEAARVEGSSGLVKVVCTPSGGAKSVRLELPKDWESSLTDEDLLGEIEEHRET